MLIMVLVHILFVTFFSLFFFLVAGRHHGPIVVER